jgi:hypothetical protein
MTKLTIINETEEQVGNTSFSAWQIGITHTPDERKTYWGKKENISGWTLWKADSLSDAHDIESYFINHKKMKGGTGGEMDSRKATFVYVF